MTKNAKQGNPLGGLSVPSVEDLTDDILGRFGTQTIDLADPIQRKRMHHAICVSLRDALAWRVFPELERATSKAVTHVLRLMEDPDYQEVRRIRRAESLKRQKEKQAEEDKKLMLAREARKQQRRGLVQ